MNPNQKKWSWQDEFTLRHDFATTPTAELARRLGRSSQAVAVKASQLGLKKDHYGIDWTPAQLKQLRQYFPTMFNKPLARMLGVGLRTMIRKARELGLEKVPDFHERKRREINRLAGEAIRKSPNKQTRFKKGEHANPAGEFKKGHTESPETRAKRSATMKAVWARKKLLAKYGL